VAEDPLVELEDLSSPKVAEVVGRFNEEVEALLGERARAHYARLRELMSQPTAVSAALLGEGVAVLYRGLREEVVLLRWSGERLSLLAPGEGEVLTGLSRVEGSANLLAVRASLEGRDEGRTYVLDASRGEVVRVIEGVAHGFCLAGGTLLYVRSYRRSGPPDGEPPPTDRLVALGDGGEEVVWGASHVRQGEFIESLHPSPDGRLVALSVHRGWASSRLYVLDTGSWEGRLVEGGGYWIRLAGWLGGSPAYVRARPGGDELVAGGRELRLERPVEAAAVSEGRLLLVDVVDARHRALLSEDPSGGWAEVELPVRHATVRGLDALGGRFLLLATSFSHRHLLALVEGGGVRVVEESAALDGVAVEDVWVRSEDGTRVHGFLVARGRPRAVVLYGYGGFGVSLTPAYSPLFHYLLELGYAVAVVNARGGREEGEEWHRAGMLERKENTFRDFAAFARLLKALGLRVAGLGSSNGGLTVAAVATRWPELLDAALVGYPVLDMLRYHLLHVGRYWVPEYGDPDDPGMRGVLLRYSPYHNIPRDRRMPPTLVFTGLNDDRVHPAHAIKFAVRARELGHPVYLRVEARSGHSGARSEVRALEAAYVVAFLEKFLA